MLPLSKVVIIALAVAVLIFVGGFGYSVLRGQGNFGLDKLTFPWTKKVSIVPSTNTDTLNVNADTGQTPAQAQDSANMKDAFIGRDKSLCDKIVDETKRVMCHIYVTNAQVIQDNDPSKCDTITQEFYKTDCHDNYTINLALKKNDKTRCEDLINKSRLTFCESLINNN